MMSNKKNENRIVYSTNPDFETTNDDQPENEPLVAGQQNLQIRLDRKQRKGKQVTLISGFIGSDNQLKELAKQLKSKCGVGGSAKDSEIIIQGDFRQKVKSLLDLMGYKSRIIG